MDGATRQEVKAGHKEEEISGRGKGQSAVVTEKARHRASKM